MKDTTEEMRAAAARQAEERDGTRDSGTSTNTSANC